jgi:ribosomal protein S18 acetylase RimI-like enzyme
MTFTVRVPEPGDVAELAELHVTTWRETYSHLLPEGYFDEAFVEGRHRMWSRLTERPRADVVVRVAEQDGRIIGFAVVGQPIGPEVATAPRDRHLYMLYVVASHHGGGAGQALLDAVLGDEPAMLWVAKENPRAIAFYRRNGFGFDGVEVQDPNAPSIVDARMVR